VPVARPAGARVTTWNVERQQVGRGSSTAVRGGGPNQGSIDEGYRLFGRGIIRWPLGGREAAMQADKLPMENAVSTPRSDGTDCAAPCQLLVKVG
jgi:hypothetical protein